MLLFIAKPRSGLEQSNRDRQWPAAATKVHMHGDAAATRQPALNRASAAWLATLALRVRQTLH